MKWTVLLAWVLGAATPASLLVAAVAGGAGAAGVVELLAVPVAAALLAFPAVGGVLASRRPRNRIAWMLLVIGFSLSTGAWGEQYWAWALSAWPTSRSAPAVLDPAQTWLPLLASISWIPAFGLIPLVVITFPTGSLPSPRWRLFVTALLVYYTFQTLTFLGHPRIGPAELGLRPANPLPFAPALLAVGSLVPDVGPLATIWLLLAGGGMLRRAARAQGVERRQLKWFLSAAALALFRGISLAITSVTGAWGSLVARLALMAWMFSFALLPVAIGIAILRYRLYDIDLLINRTLVYGALSALLAATYFGAVVLLGALLRPFAAESELAVAGSTLAVVVLFAPLRSRIQRLVDERFYRSKYDAARTLDAFSARLRDQVDLDALEREVLGVVGQTVQPTHAALWLREARR
ncbi:hypothetical protein BH18CHL2_BH18CHL2_02750 [soil metagenome]